MKIVSHGAHGQGWYGVPALQAGMHEGRHVGYVGGQANMTAGVKALLTS